MKKLILIIVFNFFALLSHAQFSLVGEAGGLSSTMLLEKNIPYFNITRLNTYYISAIPSFQINESKISLEASFLQKGFLANESTEGYRLSYISIAPQYEYNLFKLLSIFTGVEASFLVKEEVRNKSDWFSIDDVFGIRKDKLDIAFPIGARVKFGRIQLSMSYNYGIHNVNAYVFTDLDGNIERLKGFHRYFKLGLGYKFL